MPKKILVIFSLILVIPLTGCSILNHFICSFEEQFNNIPSDDEMEGYLKTITYGLQNKDEESIESIKNMFCEYTKETHNLDDEIEAFMNFIKGEISSQGSISRDTRTDWFNDKSEFYNELAKGFIHNITTDNGKRYEVYVNGYHIFRNHNEYVGLYNISIIELDDGDRIISWVQMGNSADEIKSSLNEIDKK